MSRDPHRWWGWPFIAFCVVLAIFLYAYGLYRSLTD